MGKRYLVHKLLWSNSLNRYVIPGEVIRLSEEAARPLVEKHSIELIEEEIDDDTSG